MIVVTGAAGFIGSNLVRHLNHYGCADLILVDDFADPAKAANWQNSQYLDLVPVEDFFHWTDNNGVQVDFVVHLGAQTDKTITDYAVFRKWNVEYSQRVWSWAVQKNIPLIYASSAETYGTETSKCEDDEQSLFKLKPQTLEGCSKQEFDLWVQKQAAVPPFWYGFKLFNVFGPNEEHKSKNASFAFQLIHQIVKEQVVSLPCLDGQEPLYDLIYVTDATTVMRWFMNHLPASGLYNLGTGYARPLSVVAQTAFSTLKLRPKIEWTENINPSFLISADFSANLSKLRSIHYKKSFLPLETAVQRFVKSYRKEEKK